MLLVQIGSILFGGIEKIWDKKLCMKTWYNSKIIESFLNLSCLVFFAQNVLMPQNYILLLLIFDFSCLIKRLSGRALLNVFQFFFAFVYIGDIEKKY